MRQIWIPRWGVPEVLEVREAPDPTPKDGEVRIRVRFAGINFADLMARQGLYLDAPKPPCVVGYEVSGEVDAVGAGVKELAVGDRVMAMPKFGGYTDVLCVAEGQALRLPTIMSYEEAAALPVVYLTAHHMMLYIGPLREKDKILIHSAAGGVGVAAIQLAKARKCEIFGSASASKHDFLRSLGVQHPLDSAGDTAAQVRKIIGEKGGLELILDAIGGKSFQESYDLLAPAGRMVMFGGSTVAPGKTRSLFTALGFLMSMPKFKPLPMMQDNKTVSGVNMGHLFDRPDILRPQFLALFSMYERGEIKPMVDQIFPFAEAAKAHHWLHDRKAKGKVLLKP
jgi:NADPH:quinone reductase-like Zn-dependent oxidoreductase